MQCTYGCCWRPTYIHTKDLSTTIVALFPIQSFNNNIRRPPQNKTPFLYSFKNHSCNILEVFCLYSAQCSLVSDAVLSGISRNSSSSKPAAKIFLCTSLLSCFWNNKRPCLPGDQNVLLLNQVWDHEVGTRKQKLSFEARKPSTSEAVRKNIMTGAVHKTVARAACVSVAFI